MKYNHLAPLLLVIFSTTSLVSQVSDKELAKHFKAVEKSAEKNKSLVSLDTFFYAGKPQAIKEVVKKGFLGSGEIYRLLAFKDSAEIIYIEHLNIGTNDNPNYVYDLSFIGLNTKLRVTGNDKPLDLLGEHKVIDPSGVNVANLNKLLLIKGQPTVNSIPQNSQPQNTSNGDPNKTVDRNRSGLIQIFGTSIEQGGTEIGTIEKETMAQGGAIITTYTIKYIDGSLCATAKNMGATDHNWTIVTLKDNKTHSVSSSIGKDEHSIATYLINQLYL